ncbi:MAG: CaiB/BaiF CoA transferase family protein [Anaerolineae bacterium]
MTDKVMITAETPDPLFHNLIVLSLEQALTLPFLTYRLALEGMRVIRVENPRRGDPNRYVGENVLDEEGMNTYYLPYNGGKEAITLNLATEEGRAVLHELIARLPADIFTCNTLPRNYARLGIDHEALRQIKPDLIWVGITGFGPDSNEPAYDPILQARSGFMNLTGDPDGPPQVFGLPMVDLGAAEHAYGQVMKALYRRAATGEGSRIDIAMYRSAVSWMVIPVMMARSFGKVMTRQGNTHPIFAPVSVNATADGYVYIAVGSDQQWERVTQLPGFERLNREEYQRNAGRIAAKETLNREMAEITRTRSSDELIALFNDIGVPISRIYNVAEVVEDPYLVADMIHARDSRTGVKITLPPPPVVTRFLREQGRRISFPPRLGEHNEQVYGEVLGYGLAEVAALREQGVV